MFSKLKSRSMRLHGISVSFSFVGVILLATFSSSQRVAAPQTNPISVPAPAPGKAPARRVMHPAFANAGRNPGLEIWRIENFEPVAYPQRDYGKFYTGDSFIVMNTKKDKNNKFSWDIHFWLGSQTSIDEAGAAAILTVQLDEILNGEPVQHREVQDHESSLFLGYFNNGIRYENGGVGTGFRHVQTNAGGDKRLFHVKGKRNVRVRQVNLSVSSMNKGDCFILDAGNDIYVYVGSGSKRVERLKAISAANQIRDQDHNGRARIQIIDEFSTEADKQQFFTVLGSGSPDQVPEESTSEDDEKFETNDERAVTLYKVSDASGSLKIDTIATKPLRQDMLQTSDCFILDTGSGIFVWVGRGATQQEKSQSMTRAQEFLTTKKYPAWTQVHRVVEGAESAPFKQYFATWRDVGMSHTRLIRAINENLDESCIDSLKKSGGKALAFMPDNGIGAITEVLHFKEGAMQKVSADSINILNGNAAYVIRYSFAMENRNKALVAYLWLGQSSSDTDKVAAEENASSKPDEAEAYMIVRVTQGHEPRHLRKIFNGKLITVFGKHSTNPSLFRVRGVSGDDVITEELPLKSSSLSSDDAFIVGSAEKYFVWNGLGAADFEKLQATEVAKRLNVNFDVIQEGDEPDEFWELLGGKGEYDTTIGNPGAPLLEPRLYHCKILANGRFRFEEIDHFTQDDMDVDDIMLLDGGDEIYVWIGSGAANIEKEKSYPMAMEYIRNDPTERTGDTVPLIKLEQGDEPDCFKRIFPTWDNDFWQSLRSYEEVRNAIIASNESDISDLLIKNF